MIKRTAQALYRLSQLGRLRGKTETPKLVPPSWLKEQEFYAQANYDYSQEVDQATAELLESCKDLPTARNFK